MTRSPSRLVSTLAVAALAIAHAHSASAGLITFDPADGYELGTSLSGQPDPTATPRWAGNGSLYSIASLGGGNGAARSATTVGNNFANNRLEQITGDFLGTATTATAGEVYDFGFDLRNDAAGDADGFGVAHRIRIGGTDAAPILQLQVFDNGVVQYNDGGTSVSVVNVNGARLDLDDTTGRFLDVSGTIDIDAGTYSISFDGVLQDADARLINTPAQFGQVTLQFGPTASTSTRRGISLDNLSIGVVPEPATLAVAGLGSLALLRRRSA